MPGFPVDGYICFQMFTFLEKYPCINSLAIMGVVSLSHLYFQSASANENITHACGVSPHTIHSHMP